VENSKALKKSIPFFFSVGTGRGNLATKVVHAVDDKSVDFAEQSGQTTTLAIRWSNTCAAKMCDRVQTIVSNGPKRVLATTVCDKDVRSTSSVGQKRGLAIALCAVAIQEPALVGPTWQFGSLVSQHQHDMSSSCKAKPALWPHLHTAMTTMSLSSIATFAAKGASLARLASWTHCCLAPWTGQTCNLATLHDRPHLCVISIPGQTGGLAIILDDCAPRLSQLLWSKSPGGHCSTLSTRLPLRERYLLTSIVTVGYV
jgi:hypothetical protein